jgi:hypothetical protein
MWNKIFELRREVQMNIYPIYCIVRRDNQSGWTLEDFLRETKIRYYGKCKKLSCDDPLIGGVPSDWTSGAWEVFFRFGAVGSDEPWFKTEAAARTPTTRTSRSIRDIPFNRVDLKNARRGFAQERKKGIMPMSEARTNDVETRPSDLTWEDEGKAKSPMKDPPVKLVQGMQDNIVGVMEKNIESLHDLVDPMSKDMEAT